MRRDPSFCHPSAHRMSAPAEEEDGMNQTPEGLGLGWLPDHPDNRDFGPDKGDPPAGEDRSVPDLLHELRADKTLDAGTLPDTVDLRSGFSPITSTGPTTRSWIIGCGHSPATATSWRG